MFFEVSSLESLMEGIPIRWLSASPASWDNSLGGGKTGHTHKLFDLSLGFQTSIVFTIFVHVPFAVRSKINILWVDCFETSTFLIDVHVLVSFPNK